ncbi:MAG: hypothetical protein OXE53_13095 [Deltaproteobacteria bacterium]|nr:hypothetical protein [Deltaproteobacteria bacterium]
MASGALGNSTRGTLRVFTVVTEFLQDEDYVALRAKLDLRTEQVITGELVDVSKAFVQFRGTNYRTEYDAGAEIVTRSARFELLESERRAA